MQRLTYSFYGWENAVRASRHWAPLGARQRVSKVVPPVGSPYGPSWQLEVIYAPDGA